MNKNASSSCRKTPRRRAISMAFAGFSIFYGMNEVSRSWGLGAGKRAMAIENPRLARVRKGYANGIDGQIHYRYAGEQGADEVPLICLHASPLSGILFDNWLAEIGTDRFVVAPDTPGYGGSDTPPEPPLISDLADAMIAFMDSIGLKQADVMGYHTGSFISVDLAVRYPNRIRKVVMISAPIFDAEIIADYRSRIYDPPPTFAEVLASTSESIRKNPRGMFRDVPTDERYADISIERLRHYRTGNWGFRAAFAYDLTETLPRVKQPILILNPEDDLWELTPRAKPFLNKGRIVDLPGWTHGHLDSHTAEIANIVRSFLAE